ncbi:GNAT family N-acetyltransferase [Bosea sp. BIWAKO-01]|uniref:GNAT family N-acetyltransferase n=1 Tax=Bosea sp. BIWAKO-01 TaxID=506668 RepID=UPI000852C038|nr:GNAT family N-acetyltransferase [Bosea sp. BIWAKO-01]GAU85872.1 spermidine acetyltransferase [Bosea sp. BIWAKO-01]
MPITVTPFDATERQAILGLSVSPEQDDLIASNEESLEEADERPECIPLAVRADGALVGFAMYALDPDDGHYWIYRLMIDARFQGRGYGRAALAALVPLISAEPDCAHITISYHPENERAAGLYRSFGFRETGEVIAGETVARFKVASATG